MKEVKCVVAGVGAQGVADFWFVKVRCTDDDYNLGRHYDGAEAAARENDFDPKLCYDEVEASEAFIDLFVWASASIVDVEGVLVD